MTIFSFMRTSSSFYFGYYRFIHLLEVPLLKL